MLHLGIIHPTHLQWASPSANREEGVLHALRLFDCKKVMLTDVFEQVTTQKCQYT